MLQDVIRHFRITSGDRIKHVVERNLGRIYPDIDTIFSEFDVRPADEIEVQRVKRLLRESLS